MLNFELLNAKLLNRLTQISINDSEANDNIQIISRSQLLNVQKWFGKLRFRKLQFNK